MASSQECVRFVRNSHINKNNNSVSVFNCIIWESALLQVLLMLLTRNNTKSGFSCK